MDRFELIIGNKVYSSWSLRPWLVLKHIGVGFTETRVSLYVPGYKKLIQQHSPAGRVPVLKHGNLTIWDSLAICEYLAELFPQNELWPQAPAARAEARSLSAEMHSGFNILRNLMPFNCRAIGRRLVRTQELDSEIARIEEMWKLCRKRHAAEGPWLFGRFSTADAMYAPVAMRFVTYGVVLKGAAGEYIANLEAHPPVKEWIAAAKQEQEVMEASEVGL